MKKGILFLVLVLLELQQLNPGFASEITDDYFDIATNYFNSNNYVKSLEYLNLILNIEPDNLQAYTLRRKLAPLPTNDTSSTEDPTKISGMAQTPSNLVVLSVPQVDVEKMSFDSNYYNSKGQEFYQKNDFDTAIEYFYKAVSLDKCNSQAYNSLGMAYWFKSKPSIAITYFLKANSLKPEYSQPLVNLAMLYKQLGNSRKQFCYLNKAIRLNPNDYLAYYRLGDYFKDNCLYSNAIESYKNAIKINPKFSPAYLHLALSFLEIDEFDYSLLALNQYIELCPDSDLAFSLSAKNYSSLSRYSDAKTSIKKAIEISDNGDYQFELAKIDYNLDDYNSALPIFQGLLQTGGASAEIFNYIGLCNYKLKKMDVALPNLNRAIELDGLKPIYYYNLAQYYKTLNDNENYAININNATKIDPINYQDFIDLSQILVYTGNPCSALNLLDEALSKYPNKKSLYLAKLKIYEAIKDNLHYNETKDLIDARFNIK